MISSKSAVSPSRMRRTISSSDSGSVLFISSRTVGLILILPVYRIESPAQKTLQAFEFRAIDAFVTGFRSKTLLQAGGKMQNTDNRLNTTWWALRVLFGFMHIVGVIEIIAGIVVLSHFTKVGAYVVTAWLVAIALNLLIMGKFLDVAVRDLGLAVAAFSLDQLTAVREESTSTVRMRTTQPLPARS